MPVTIMCPNLLCKKILAVPNASRGSKVRCSYCGTVLAVPWAKPPQKKNTIAAIDTPMDDDDARPRKKR